MKLLNRTRVGDPHVRVQPVTKSSDIVENADEQQTLVHVYKFD